MARFLRILGLVLVLASPSLMLATRRTNKAQIDQMMDALKRHQAGDTTGFASVAYHASYALESEGTRWHPTGYMTLGTLGVVLGVSLITIGYRHTLKARRAQPR